MVVAETAVEAAPDSILERLEAISAAHPVLDEAPDAAAPSPQDADLAPIPGTGVGLTIGALMEALGQRAFGAVLFVLALPCCIPFLYGVPQIVAVPMMIIALQMAAGRREPWLPQKLAARRIEPKGLARMARGGRKYFGWVERLAKPRLTWLTGRRAERLVGGVLVLFCASILVPLPATNTAPGIAVALTSFGLMERDGLLTLAGLALGLAWIAGLVALVTLAAFGVQSFV